jgi:hypothetical protein
MPSAETSSFDAIAIGARSSSVPMAAAKAVRRLAGGEEETVRRPAPHVAPALRQVPDRSVRTETKSAARRRHAGIGCTLRIEMADPASANENDRKEPWVGPADIRTFISQVFWHDALAEGLVAPAESSRAVLLVVGRQSCGGSRALVEKTIGKEEIQEYLDGHSMRGGDADTPEPAVARWSPDGAARSNTAVPLPVRRRRSDAFDLRRPSARGVPLDLLESAARAGASG